MRKYWLCIAIAGVLTIISGCGAGSSSKSSANEGYIMETAAGAMEYGNAGVAVEREMISEDAAGGAAFRDREPCDRGNWSKTDKNGQYGRGD